MNIPSINTSGLFKFSEPFNSLLNKYQKFTVTSIRSLEELEASGERPADTVYRAVGLSKKDYADDSVNKVPIVVFKTDGGEHFYVPANRIQSQPDISGVNYVKKSLVIQLGYVPVNLDLDTSFSVIKDTVYNTIGIKSTVDAITTSNKVMVTNDKHNVFMRLLANEKTVDKNYQTKYNELLVLYNKQKQLLANLEEFIIEG